MLTNYVVLDIASAPLPDAAAYMPPASEIEAPDNYVNAEAIQKYQAKTHAARLAKAGLDIDLAQLTGVALWLSDDAEPMILTGNTSSETTMLETVAAAVKHGSGLRPCVTFNGNQLDLLLLMRRALYLGVAFPVLSVDRFKGTNVDVMLELSYRDMKRVRSLQFYARRLKLGLTKTLSGEEEARVPLTGQWSELRESLDHDVRCTKEIATWAKLIR